MQVRQGRLKLRDPLFGDMVLPFVLDHEMSSRSSCTMPFGASAQCTSFSPLPAAIDIVRVGFGGHETAVNEDAADPHGVEVLDRAPESSTKRRRGVVTKTASISSRVAVCMPGGSSPMAFGAGIIRHAPQSHGTTRE